MRQFAAVLAAVVAIGSSTILSQQTPPAAPSGSIEGVVVRSDTGDPVAGAQVTLTPLNVPPALALGGAAVAGPTIINTVGGGGGGAGGAIRVTETLTAAAPAGAALVPAGLAAAPGQPQAIPAVTTASDGKFVFKGLRASGYRVAAVSNGYVRQEYGQRAANGQGRILYLADGQTFKDASIRLIPSGTLTGRIFDDMGQPAIGAPVQLLRPIYNTLQGRTFQAVGTGAADDRGEYRIFGLAPGRYYMIAGSQPGPLSRPAALGGTAGSTRFEILFYPNTTDVDQAIPIEIKAGGEMALNMTLKRQPQVFNVRGKIVDATTGAPPPAVQVSMAYRNLTGGGGSFSSGNAYNPATGTFQLQNVAPGEYHVQARPQQTAALAGDFGGTPVNLEARQVAQAQLPFGSVPVRVVDADVENVVLTLTTGVTLSGRFTVEGQPLSAVTGLERLRLVLQPATGIPIGTQNPAASAVAADGTFQLVGVREGEYRVNVSNPLQQQGLYVKAVRYAGEEILGKPFRFSGSGGGAFEVVLRPGAVQVSGTVVDTQGQLLAGVQAHLVPADPSRSDLFRTVVTDGAGKFTMPGATPGDYRVFSWEAVDNQAWMEPKFLEEYEGQGQILRVVESTPATVQVRMIPAP